MMLLKTSKRNWTRRAIIPAALLLGISSCTTQTQTTTSFSGARQETVQAAPAHTVADDSKIVKTVINTRPIHDTSPLNGFDPCGLRIQDVCGALIEYFTAKHHYPAKVSELLPYAIGPLDTTCPVDGKDYVCAPYGLSAPGKNITIYIYDAEPVHSGQRWCVVRDGSINGAQGFTTVHMPEVEFAKFSPNAAPTTGTVQADHPQVENLPPR